MATSLNAFSAELVCGCLKKGGCPKSASPKSAQKRVGVQNQLYGTFLGRRICHLLVEEGGYYIGIFLVADFMKAKRRQASAELKELSEMVSLECGENWKEVQARR